MTDVNEIISQNEKLSDLMVNLPARIKSRLIVKTYKPNSILFYQDDILSNIYIHYDGEVQIYNTFNDGYTYEIGRTDFINFIGDQDVLSGHKLASVTIKTITECSFIVMKSSDYLNWIQNDSKIAMFVINVLAMRCFDNSRSKGLHGYLSKSKLVESYFCSQYELSDKDTVILLQKRQDMAYCIGVSLRSLERAISSLKKNNLISIQNRKISIDQNQYLQMVDELES